jgi:hypothetical protein
MGRPAAAGGAGESGESGESGDSGQAGLPDAEARAEDGAEMGGASTRAAPGGAPAPDADPVLPARRPRRGYWIPGLIAVAALTAIGVAFGAGDLNHRSPRVLNGTDVAQEIALGMQAREGTHSPPAVRCPVTEPVRTGWRFVCTRLDPGPPVRVRVVEIDNRGQLRWSLAG